MGRFRSRSTHDGQEPRTRRWWAFAAPGTRTRRSGSPGLTRARLATRMLLLVALATSSLALTQCRMVGDSLTGVRVDSFNRRSDCLKDCKDVLKDQLKAEKDNHKELVRACDGNVECITSENARYQAAVQAIEAAFLDCLNSCHDQGGGTVGQ